MKRFLFYVCLFALFYSCNSDDDSQATNQPEANFYALTVGNSWVYKNYYYNTQTEVYDDIGIIDSISIIGTEVVNNNTYFKFRRWTTGNEDGNYLLCNPNGEHFELLRDSVGYLVRDDGNLKYINNFFDEILIDSQNWGDQYFHLQEEAVNISTIAGNFNCLEMLHYAYLSSDNELSPGQDRYSYSDGVGLVFNTVSFVTNPIHILERRLDSYNIN
jgi:hypothetical protein